jgi:hypothetical protein
MNDGTVMSEASDLDRLFENIRELFAKQYTRGQEDAIARIMRAVSPTAAAVGERATLSPTVTATVAKNSGGRNRASKGAPRALIDRVLTEHKWTGASASDILDSANGPDEKAVSLSGLRFALAMGREKGTYKNHGGRWYLTEYSAADQANR